MKNKLELVRALELEDKEKQQSLKTLKNCLIQYLIKISNQFILKYVQELLEEKFRLMKWSIPNDTISEEQKFKIKRMIF